jgi:hypothetical protein
VIGHSKIFVASSKESLEFSVGLKVEAAVKARLRNPNTQFEPWTRAFDLSKTYIESLEKVIEEVDFAILIITPDDRTISRHKRTRSPRDNVIFELGVFMGSLGRDRCFVLKEESADLKLPTDLLGVHFATFSYRDLSASVDACGLPIAEPVEEQKTRPRLPKDVMIAQAAHREFCQSVEGTWWERIPIGRICELTFFQVEWAPMYNSVSLSDGRTYDRTGEPVAKWESLLARVDGEKRQILYHWQGRFTDSDRANMMFNGQGEMTFDLPVNSQSGITRGEGKFWDVDETHPANTKVRSTQLRRVADDGTAATMTDGTSKQIRSLVVKTLSHW